MPTLIKWSSNWADEMDVEGFIIVDEEDLDLFKKNLEKDQPITVSIGTNEWIDYNSVKDLAKQISILKITEQDAQVIHDILGKWWGFTNFYWQVLELD